MLVHNVQPVKKAKPGALPPKKREIIKNNLLAGNFDTFQHVS